jgi:eukaryotic-like serine/threonine-protein kinase
VTQALARLSAALADRYRIERELGAGGMATVYLAHDLRHDRHVALKVLRPELAAILGADRFLAEIKTTANLQHPHILSLFDSGAADGMVFYVMPYVEGESLRDRLKREHQLRVEDSVRIACEVADALHYAHGHGIVHRDIKPENILLHGGHAQVADFGIALAAVRSEGGTRLTETGMSLGTPHYMAPEQAMGEREITPKADIYALGVVLYEMLTGEPPFTGSTAQAIIARVMTESPRPLTLQRHTIPPHVEAAVETALEKLPADRFGTAAEFAGALLDASRPIGRAAGPKRRRARPRPVLIAAAVGLVVLGAAAGVLLAPGGAAPTAVARLSVTLPAGHRISGTPLPVVTVAPDGSALAYVVDQGGESVIFLRRLDDVASRPVTGSDGGCCPQFSADGRWLSFGRATGLFRVPVEGGSPVSVPFPSGAIAGVWAADRVVITTGSGHLAYVRSDGSMDTIAAPDSASGRLLQVTDVHPNGRILATLGFAGPLLSIDPGSGRRDTLVNALVTGAAFSQGHIAWVEQSGVAYGARVDGSGRRILGQPAQLDAGVRITPGGYPAFATSRTGLLAFVGAQPSELVLVDRSGQARVLSRQRRRYHSPRISPDGRWVAVDVTEASTRDVWLLDRRDSSFTRLSFETRGHDPMWTPDGRQVVYAADVGGPPGIFMRNADGSGAADSVLILPSGQLTAHTNGATGEVLAVLIGGSGQDILRVPLRGPQRTATPLLAAPYVEGWPALSPDGRWLAYVSDESGRGEVYVRPFPGPGPRVIVSQNGGSEPMWARTGRELFYKAIVGEPVLISASVVTVPEFRVLSRRALFAVGDYESAAPHADYDVLPDGSGFVMVRLGRASDINVLLNWPDLVRRQNSGRSR